MTSKERRLYHQIHPVKLLTDITTSFLSTYFLWLHDTIVFLILFLLPSVLVTILLTRFVDLEHLRDSRLGRYVRKYMTPSVELVRIIGQIAMWVAAWYHKPLAIAIGFLVILVAWGNGLFKMLRPKS